MNRIEIYSNKNKAFLLFLGSVAFVILGFFIFLNADNMRSALFKSPLIIKTAGAITILFFGIGIYVSVKQLIRNKLMLVIDENGISFNPARNELIKWVNIDGFSEIKINGNKIIVIEVNNSTELINNETNRVRKNLMKFNLKNFGSPFNISVATMNLRHAELKELLNENLIKYKYYKV